MIMHWTLTVYPFYQGDSYAHLFSFLTSVMIERVVITFKCIYTFTHTHIKIKCIYTNIYYSLLISPIRETPMNWNPLTRVVVERVIVPPLLNCLLHPNLPLLVARQPPRVPHLPWQQVTTLVLVVRGFGEERLQLLFSVVWCLSNCKN